MQDRTSEFHSCVATLQKSSATRNGATSGSVLRKGSKSEFYSAAQSISQDINATSEKLQRLAQLCQKRSIFDDHTTAIQELTYVIKQDLAKITESVTGLHSLKATKDAKGAQRSEHVDSVVGSLRKGVNGATKNFKDILEVRTKNMRESKSRTDQFVHAGPVGRLAQDSPLLIQNRASSAPPYSPSKEKNEFLSLNIDGDNPYGSQQFQSQALATMESTDQYLESRSTAIETIESTIAELGGIFQQLAQMVSEQRESVQRIDANTEDVLVNVDTAQREIMKYWRRVSSNRMLMVKIFGILIIFFLLFVLLR